MENSQVGRRSFFKTSALGALGTISVPAILGGCSNSSPKEENLNYVSVPEILEKAPDGKPLKAGLIGCGGRGSGAAVNFIEAGNGLQITALADIFMDKVEACREALKAKGQNIPDENCFTGFDAYKQVIDSGVDIVLLCEPPVFRPVHYEYAVQKGKHCFIEKPCAVDPVGARKMLVLGKQAEQKNLSSINGFVRRWQKDVLETYRRVAGGAIGQITSVHISRMSGAMWTRQREKGWNDMEYVMRNWVNFTWMCGDHIVDNLIHEIDLMSLFLGEKIPERAEATGGRQRRVSGDMYDFFSVEYRYDDNRLRAHCTTRNINGCDNQHIVLIYGSKGYVNVYKGTIYDLEGTVIWQYPYPKRDDPDQSMSVPDGYLQELIQLVTAIRAGKTVNDMEQHVQSTLMAIMARESAYTGKFITWDQIMASDLKLGPDSWQFGPIPGFKEEVPIAGVPPKV